MTRIDDAAKTLTNWADSEGGLESVARNYDGDLTGAAQTLDADGHLLPDGIDDLVGTRVGLALAAQAWSEGRTEGIRQVRSDRDGITRKHERNPYSAELCKLINAEEHTNDQ